MVANEVNKAQKLKKVKDEQKAQAAANAANGGTSAKLGENELCFVVLCVRCVRWRVVRSFVSRSFYLLRFC